MVAHIFLPEHPKHIKNPSLWNVSSWEYLEVKSRGDSTSEATKRETPRRWRARHNIQEATGRPDKMSVFVVDTYLPLYRLSSLSQDGICEI